MPLADRTVEGLLQILWPAAVFVVVTALGYPLRHYLSRWLNRWRVKGDSRLAEMIVSAVRGPFVLVWLMVAASVAVEFSQLPSAMAAKVERWLSLLATFSLTMVAANILCGYVRIRAEKIEEILPVTSLTENIIRIVVYSVGGMVILNGLGVSIAPILATLGVGGLAVALALKDTLSNFFAGFHLIVNGQVRVGDYLKLGSGEEGTVTDISWRTTQIKTLQGNLILVPNSKLTELIITNYTLADKEVAVLVKVGVHYKSDLARVEEVTCQVARQVMEEVPGGVPGFAPFVRYSAFGDSSVDFTAVLKARTFADQFLVRHEFIKRLHERFAQEGIVIPYPIRAINTTQEKGHREQ